MKRIEERLRALERKENWNTWIILLLSLTVAVLAWVVWTL